MTALDWTELGKGIKAAGSQEKLHFDSSQTKNNSKYILAGVLITLTCVFIRLRFERKKHLKELSEIEKYYGKEIKVLKSKISTLEKICGKSDKTTN